MREVAELILDASIDNKGIIGIVGILQGLMVLLITNDSLDYMLSMGVYVFLWVTITILAWIISDLGD